MNLRKVIVIGAGIGGIAIAIRLAARGFSVSVLEKNAHPGGKLSEIRGNGFRFDAGPSLFTLPGLVSELYEICGLQTGDHFSYRRLENICRYHFEDGTVINAWHDPQRFGSEIEQKTADSKDRLLSFLKKSRILYELTNEVFIFSSFHRRSTFTSRSFFRSLVRVHRLDVFRSMHAVIRRHFTDPRVIQIFDRYATYNGSNPYLAPGTLNVIPHLEHNTGAYFPEKGMFDIIRSLVELSLSLGVKFHFDTPVNEILAGGGKIQGVKTTRGIEAADLVISDVDVIPTYRMMAGADLPPAYSRYEKSSSALIFYWGIKEPLPELDLHNIFFSSSYREEFDHLFRKKTIFSDPTVYVFISSRAVPSDAPEGSQNWFVMINVPENTGQDWPRLTAEARRNILSKLDRILGTRLEDHIEFEDHLDPRRIESRTASHNGSLYGLSSNSRFSAFRRHPNFSRKIRGLYFVGGSVHPGGGIPLCLASAKIVDTMIP